MSKSVNFLLGTIVGAAAASVAALLLAPKSGKELREDLNVQFGGLKDKMGDYTDYLQEKGNEFSTVAKDKAADFSEQANDFYGQVKEKGNESLEKAKVNTEDLRKNFKAQTDQLASKLKSSKADLDELADDVAEDIVIDSQDALDVLDHTEDK